MVGKEESGRIDLMLATANKQPAVSTTDCRSQLKDKGKQNMAGIKPDQFWVYKRDTSVLYIPQRSVQTSAKE